MSVYFREMAGSPVEWYDSGGLHAKREFITKWEDRDAFAVEILGSAAVYGDLIGIAYPGKSQTLAVKVRYEPLDPTYLDPKELASLTSDVNSYSKSYAKATVEYATAISTEESNPAEATLTYEMSCSGEYLPIGAGGWLWNDTMTPIPASQVLVKWVPLTEHRLTWFSVESPSWSIIQSLQGTVNSVEFLGRPAGTVLFVGVKASKQFLEDLEEENSPFTWQIEYVFRERSLKSGGLVYGWNHIYRETPAGWTEVTNSTIKLYDLADLNALLPS